jgi:hypothetical protein
MMMANKVLDQIELKEDFNLFKKDLIPFCSKIQFNRLMNSHPFKFQM